MMMFSLAGIPPLEGFFAKCSGRRQRSTPIDNASRRRCSPRVVGAYYYLTIVRRYSRTADGVDPCMELRVGWRSPACQELILCSPFQGPWSASPPQRKVRFFDAHDPEKWSPVFRTKPKWFV